MKHIFYAALWAWLFVAVATITLMLDAVMAGIQ